VTDEKKPDEYIYKIIVIGDPMVGKTSLLMKFATSHFDERYIQTIGANITTKNILINGCIISMMVWDIAGQEEFSEMRFSYFEGANGIIIVYDITRRETLDNVDNWYRQCLKHNIGHQPTILVGNKNDKKSERKVEKQEGLELAKKMRCPFFETSALTGDCVENMFIKSASEVHKLHWEGR